MILFVNNNSHKYVVFTSDGFTTKKLTQSPQVQHLKFSFQKELDLFHHSKIKNYIHIISLSIY